MAHHDEQHPSLFDSAPDAASTSATGDGDAADVKPVRSSRPEQVSNSGDTAEARPGYQHVQRVGWIPEAWDPEKIGSCLKELDAGTSVGGEDRCVRENERGVLKVSAVSYSHFDPVEHKVVSPEDFERLTVTPTAGSIIVSRANTYELVGASVYVHDDHPDLYLPDKLWQLTVDEGKADARWLNYVLSTARLRFNIAGAATGSSGSMKNISQKRFLNLLVPKPSLPEQRRIAAILATWDRALEQVGSLIDAKERRLRGLMQRLLTGETRFPEFAGTPWREVKIGSLFRRVKRPVEWNDEAKYDLVSVSRGSKGLYHRETVFGSDIKTKKLHTLREGDFVISRMQVVHGATALVTLEFDGTHASNSYIILVPRDETLIDPGFFARLSRLPHMYHLAYLSSYGVHIEKMTFNPKFYYKSKVRIPPTIEEQERIVSVLSAAEAEVEKLRRQRQALEDQKNGVMQRLLTGAVRVPAARETAGAKDLSGLEDLNRSGRSGGRSAGGKEA